MNTTINITNCARCGLTHNKLVFTPLTQSANGWTHYALCPTNKEPIMMQIIKNMNEENISEKEIKLINSTDACFWAKTWIAALAKNPTIASDEGAMIGWFSNAIMAGYDAGRRITPTPALLDQLKEEIFATVGQASMCWEPLPSSEVFDSEQAGKIANTCIANIQAIYAGAK